LVCVPEPVCQTLSGKLSSSFPEITSSEALITAFETCGVISLYFALTIAAAFLTMAIE